MALAWTKTDDPAWQNINYGSDTATFADAAIGSAAADRIVVVHIHWGLTTRTLNTVTIGGDAATIAVQGNWEAIAYLAVPAGTTADVVCVFSDTINLVGVHVGKLTGAAAAPLDTETGDYGFQAGPWTLDNSITIPTGGIGLASAGADTDAPPPNPGWSPGTTDYYTETSEGNTHGMSSCYRTTAGEWQPDVDTSDWDFIQVSVVGVTWEPGVSGYTLTATGGSFSLTGAAASLEHGRNLGTETGAIVVSGTAAGLVQGYALPAGVGGVAVAGSAAALEHDKILTAAAGAVVVTGSAVDLRAGATLTAEAGAFTVTGTAAALEHDKLLPAAAGSVAVTGTAASLEVGYKLIAAAGSFAVSGTAAALEHDKVLGASAGSVALTGSAVTLSYGVSYTLTADAGSVSVSGTAVSLEYGRALLAIAGSFAVSGVAAALEHDKVLSVSAGSFTLTGSDVNMLYSGEYESPPSIRSYTVAAESRSFTVPAEDRSYTVPAEDRSFKPS